MKHILSLLLSIFFLNTTAAFLSCSNEGETKNAEVVLHLKEVRDTWRYSSLQFEKKPSFKRSIGFNLYVKNNGPFDAFVPIYENDPLGIDSNYQSRLVLCIDGHEIDYEIGVERKWTISSAPNALYLREYQSDEANPLQIAREKQIYSGDLGRKIYSGDSIWVYILVNEAQLHEAGINEAMDVHEIIKKMQIRYEKNFEDLKFDDLPISDITFDLQNPIVEIRNCK